MITAEQARKIQDLHTAFVRRQSAKGVDGPVPPGRKEGSDYNQHFPILESSGADWDEYDRKVRDILGLPPLADAVPDFGAMRADLDVDDDEIERAFDVNQLRFKAGTSQGGEWRRMSDFASALLKDWLRGDGPDDPLGDNDFSEPQLRTILKDFRAAAAGDPARVARLTPPRAKAGEAQHFATPEDREKEKVARLKKLLYEDATASARAQRDARRPSAKFTLQGKAHRDLDVGVFKDADGRPRLFKTNDRNEQLGLVEKFDTLAELEQWAKDNGEPRLASWASKERKKLPEGGALGLYTPAEVEGLAKGLDMTVPHSHTVVAAEGRRRVEAVLDDVDRVLADGGSNRALLATLQGHRDNAPKGVVDELTAAVEAGDKDRVREVSAGIRARLGGDSGVRAPEVTGEAPSTPAKKVSPAEQERIDWAKWRDSQEGQQAAARRDAAQQRAADAKGMTLQQWRDSQLEGLTDRQKRAKLESWGLTPPAPAKKAEPAPSPATPDISSLRQLGDKEAIRDQLDLLTLDKIKPLLASEGLPRTGKKRDLVDRLVEHLSGGGVPGDGGAPVRKATPPKTPPAGFDPSQLDGLTVRQKRARLKAMGFSQEQIDELAPTAAAAKKVAAAKAFPLAPGYRGPLGRSRQNQRDEALRYVAEAGPNGIGPAAGVRNEALDALERMGYVRWDGQRWRLTDQGRAYLASAERSEGLDPEDIERAEVDLEADDEPDEDEEADDEPVDEMDLALEHYDGDVERAAGRDVTPGHDELHHYWTRGEGLAKWVGSPKPWTTLVAHLTKHVGPEKAKVFASRWFIEVFGFASGSDANRVAHGRPPRGHRVGPG